MFEKRSTHYLRISYKDCLFHVVSPVIIVSCNRIIAGTITAETTLVTNLQTPKKINRRCTHQL